MCGKSTDWMSVATIQWYGTIDETTHKSWRLKKKNTSEEWRTTWTKLCLCPCINFEKSVRESVQKTSRIQYDVEMSLRHAFGWTFVDRSRLQSSFLFFPSFRSFFLIIILIDFYFLVTVLPSFLSLTLPFSPSSFLRFFYSISVFVRSISWTVRIC